MPIRGFCSYCFALLYCIFNYVFLSQIKEGRGNLPSTEIILTVAGLIVTDIQKNTLYGTEFIAGLKVVQVTGRICDRPHFTLF